MDEFDRRILRQLARDGRASWLDIAEKINLSASACQRRAQAMQKKGIIRHFTVSLDHKAMGLQVRAFVQVKVERHSTKKAEEFKEAIRLSPEVQSCYQLAGSIDYLLDVIAPDLESFARFIEQKLLTLEVVTDAASSIVLEEVKSFEPKI